MKMTLVYLIESHIIIIAINTIAIKCTFYARIKAFAIFFITIIFLTVTSFNEHFTFTIRLIKNFINFL